MDYLEDKMRKLAEEDHLVRLYMVNERDRFRLVQEQQQKLADEIARLREGILQIVIAADDHKILRMADKLITLTQGDCDYIRTRSSGHLKKNAK